MFLFTTSRFFLYSYKINNYNTVSYDSPGGSVQVFELSPSSFVNVYDITLLSIDNILAVFNGTFTILTLLFTIIGNYFNSIYYKNEKKNFFYVLKYDPSANQSESLITLYFIQWVGN